MSAALVAAVLVAASGGVPAHADAKAAPVGFFTSFEAGQPQPTWTDTPETPSPCGRPPVAEP